MCRPSQSETGGGFPVPPQQQQAQQRPTFLPATANAKAGVPLFAPASSAAAGNNTAAAPGPPRFFVPGNATVGSQHQGPLFSSPPPPQQQQQQRQRQGVSNGPVSHAAAPSWQDSRPGTVAGGRPIEMAGIGPHPATPNVGCCSCVWQPDYGLLPWRPLSKILQQHALVAIL